MLVAWDFEGVMLGLKFTDVLLLVTCSMLASIPTVNCVIVAVNKRERRA